MPKRRYAALTMVRDEDFFLKIWHRYYAREFGAENLFVIDHNSQNILPQTVLEQPYNITRIPFDTPQDDLTGEERKFDVERFRFVSSTIAALLRYYDCVIFNDADELFLVDTDEGVGLRDYLDSLPDIGVRAGMGMELYQDVKTEAAFDPDRPIFEQRKNFRYWFHFCKPWIVAKPHGIQGHGSNQPFHFDPNLLLVHLHHMDLDQMLIRREHRHVDYKQGRGGAKSRWSHDAERLKEQMNNLSNRPIEPDDMPHKQVLEELFPGLTEQEFSEDNYERLSQGRKHIIEVDRFVDPYFESSLFHMRFQFPKRFKSKA